jgi:4-amino-4-deoxy-L-arabinose transferase-like glycosyltransferase
VKSTWRWPCAALALGVAGLIAAYSAVVPAFETPDEPGHFRYVQALAAGRGLPVQGQAGDLDPEFSQPPLYYAAEAALARIVPAQGAPVPDFDHHNPYQNQTAEGNVNLFSHPAIESFPWTGQVLQLHAMRLLNLLFVAVTLLSTFGIARQAGLSIGLAAAATAVLGLLPQFDFIAGALNADNAITAAAGLTLYLLLRWLHSPPNIRAAALLGLTSAAAMLSKLSGAAVLALVLAAMLWRAWREKNPRSAAQAALAAGVALLGAGWWYIRNLVLYGDLLGWQPMLASIGAMLRPHPLTLLDAALLLFHQRATAIGVFGWNNLRLPQPIYLAADILAALAIAGLLLLAYDTARTPLSLPPAVRVGPGEAPPTTSCPALAVRVGLLLWSAAFAASLIRWVEVNTDAAQWRLLFPAFPAITVLLTLGLSRLSKYLSAVAATALAAVSLASLPLVIHPAYSPPPPYAGPIQHQLNARFGDRLELVGYDDPQPRNPSPGDPVILTLYWRALQPIARDAIVDLAALDVGGLPGLKESTWPAYGRAPTSSWRTGEIVRDRHVLAGAGKSNAGVWNLLLDVFEPLEGAPRLTLTGGGTTLNVGRFLVAPPQPSMTAPEASFQGNLEMVGHTQLVTPGRLAVTLTWRAVGPVQLDYTVFVHLLDKAGKLVAQDDSQPAGGRFPTSLIPPGLTVEDAHILDVSALPPGAYQLELGLYDAQTGTRLELRGGREAALRWPITLG